MYNPNTGGTSSQSAGMKKPRRQTKYYFIYCKCKMWGRTAPDRGGFPTATNIQECQFITTKHPIQWQLDCNKRYNKIVHVDGSENYSDYMVISWQELSRAEYEKYKGEIG